LGVGSFIFIFATWWWPKYYYIYLPFISLPLALNCCMIVSIFFFTIRNRIRPEPRPLRPVKPENMVLLMPCYNETYNECTRSLDSLVAQVGVEQHAKAILVICDGRVRGPGMEKTTGQYLNEDILVDRTHCEVIRDAHVAWDGQLMAIELTRGTYKGVPFCCIVKQQNQGKRDSLIVARSFLYNFNIRKRQPKVVFSPYLFSTLSSWLVHEVGVQNVDVLIGMDADTVFDPGCIAELVKESHFPHTVGMCGYVAVDFQNTPFNPWSLYQSAEYTIAQGLRRLHQSVATHKVSCLPGCCQLLRINKTTCGDLVLINKFGYHPDPLDGMLKQIRATASEDRNHVCLMLTTYPRAQTRQALRARAYTDVPHSWSVFLSQRRRWTLGATGNDLLLVTAGGTQWWERILALSNVLTWCLNVFVIASIGSMVVAFLRESLFLSPTHTPKPPLLPHFYIKLICPSGDVTVALSYRLPVSAFPSPSLDEMGNIASPNAGVTLALAGNNITPLLMAICIRLCTDQPYWIILAFASVMIVPILYYVGITLWIPRNGLERWQYLVGLVMFVVCGPFLNIAVLLFALWNMDSFGWGKTRKVIASDDNGNNETKTSNSSGEIGVLNRGDGRSSTANGVRQPKGEGQSRERDEKWAPVAIMANDEESQLWPLQSLPTT
jgi:cellulose synthase/poly-beta-1,6-N-acetylglucosamine synthase-like glycosyltransferase